MLAIRILCVLIVIVASAAFEPMYHNVTLGAKPKADAGCVCTTVSCPVSGENPLTEGGGHTKAVYTYAIHNGVPVVVSATATLTPQSLDAGSATTSCTQAYSRTLQDDGKQDCDAGHILAHRLGGYGEEPINIFPQDPNINRGIYAQFEGQIYECTKTTKTASLSWKFTYPSASKTMPSKVVYSATFDAGTCKSTPLSQTFTNVEQ
jgi:hypothetical protein